MSAAELPLRAGHLTIAALVDLYMAHYEGRDTTRVQRLSWWVERLGGVRIDEVSDDCWRRPKTEPLLRVVPTQN